MKPSNTPARAPDAISVEFERDTVVYHRGTAEVHRLDAIGSMVWRFLDGQTTIDELETDLAAAFGVDPAVVRDDVATLLERLGRAGLLSEGPAPEPRRGPLPVTNPPSR